jgi:hypothetical protein
MMTAKAVDLMKPPRMSSVVSPSQTAARNELERMSKNCVPTTHPPKMPTASAIRVKSGSVTTSAISRGATSLRTGSVPRARMASICCETTIEPNSAAMAEATRPATISPLRTGPSSRTRAVATSRPVWSCAP